MLTVSHRVQFSSVYRSCELFETPWTSEHQASLSFTISLSLLKLMPIESVMPSNHLILCRPLLLLPSVFPSIRVFSNELALCTRWPKFRSFSFSIRPSNEYSELISFRTGLVLLFKILSRVSSNTTVQISSLALLLIYYYLRTHHQDVAEARNAGPLTTTMLFKVLKPIS